MGEVYEVCEVSQYPGPRFQGVLEGTPAGEEEGTVQSVGLMLL